MSSPSRFPSQSAHREECSVSRALLSVKSSRWTDPFPMRPSGAPMERGARLHSLLLHTSLLYTSPLPSSLTDRHSRPLRPPPISFPVTLLLLPTALILSRGHSYKVSWNWKPSLWRTKLCSMQYVLTNTSQKSGQTTIAQWKILHLLHTITNAHSNIHLARVNL